jgi:hypothetical protein
LNVSKLHFKNSSAKTIIVDFVEQEFMQRKCDSQLCFIKIFKDLSQIGKDEHSRLSAKQVSNEDAWCYASMKLDTWK